MKKLVKITFFALILTLVFFMVACDSGAATTTLGGDPVTSGIDTVVSDTIVDTEEITTVPTLEIGTLSSLDAVSGDFSITLSWDAYAGAECYDVYMRYHDAIGEMALVCEGITETSTTLTVDYGRTTDVKVIARGTFNGEDAVYAESEISAKSNGVRANEYALHDNVMYYHSPEIVHAGCGIVWINGEVWISDGGNTGDGSTLVNMLLDLRREFLGDNYSTYENDTNCKLAINLYLTHYHSDHSNAIIKSILPNRYFTVEEVHASKPEKNPSTRPGQYAEFHSIYKARYGQSNSTLTEHEFGEHARVEFDNSTAVVDFYPALMDWTQEYYTESGATDIRKGWSCMTAIKSNTSTARTLAVNCNSMWAAFRYENTSILFTGDTYHQESNIIKPMISHYGVENFDVDILVYLHHGDARYSRYLYDVTTPTQTIFNVARSEIDGNTTNSANYAKTIGCKLYWAINGGFTASMDGNAVTFDREPDDL